MSAGRKSKLTPAPKVAAAAVVQILVATGKRFTVDGLRERLRDCFREDGNREIRAVASVTNVELIDALLSANNVLLKVGLQIRITAGMVSLSTTKIESERLRDFIRQHAMNVEQGDLSEHALEVLACIALHQPLCQAEVDRYFDADKRGIVQKTSRDGVGDGIRGTGKQAGICHHGKVFSTLWC